MVSPLGHCALPDRFVASPWSTLRCHREEAAKWAGPCGAGLSSILAAVAHSQELSDKVTLDSSILSEQFYFWTVVVMWLIHVGFMSYEAGVARRKNVMSTAMKNILTIAVVTPTFYYFGWWIYGCFSKGIVPITPGDFIDSAHASDRRWPTSARRRIRGRRTSART